MAIGLSELGTRAKKMLFSKIKVRPDATETITPAARTPSFLMIPEERDPWNRHWNVVRTPGKGNRKLRCR